MHLLHVWEAVQRLGACTMQAACPLLAALSLGGLAAAPSLASSNARWWMLCSPSQEL